MLTLPIFTWFPTLIVDFSIESKADSDAKRRTGRRQNRTKHARVSPALASERGMKRAEQFSELMREDAAEIPRLLIVGGAEDRTGPCRVLSAFICRAGGNAARVVVIPAASELPEAVGEEYRTVFLRLGAASVDILDLRARDEAKHDAGLQLIDGASAVFFTGGDQARIVSLLGGTPIDTLLHRRVEQGMLLGGTSAGAAVMSGTMIMDGESLSVRSDSVSVGAGMEFLHGAIVDQHFGQRGRIQRLLAVVAQFPHNIGIGIDEDTALFVQGHRAMVIGSGSVTVIDAGDTTFNDAADVRGISVITLCGIMLHSLPHGRGFDLRSRCPILELS
jgi:cyanophycinase